MSQFNQRATLLPIAIWLFPDSTSAMFFVLERNATAISVITAQFTTMSPEFLNMPCHALCHSQPPHEVNVTMTSKQQRTRRGTMFPVSHSFQEVTGGLETRPSESWSAWVCEEKHRWKRLTRSLPSSPASKPAPCSE